MSNGDSRRTAPIVAEVDLSDDVHAVLYADGSVALELAAEADDDVAVVLLSDSEAQRLRLFLDLLAPPGGV